MWRAVATLTSGEQSFAIKTRCTCQWGLITPCGLSPQPCPADINGICLTLRVSHTLESHTLECGAHGALGVYFHLIGVPMGNVSVLQKTTANMSLLDSIKSANKLGIPTDGFFSCVFQSVQASDDNLFLNFFMHKNSSLRNAQCHLQ